MFSIVLHYEAENENFKSCHWPLECFTVSLNFIVLDCVDCGSELSTEQFFVQEQGLATIAFTFVVYGVTVLYWKMNCGNRFYFSRELQWVNFFIALVDSENI